MSVIAIILSCIVSCLGILTNCSIIVLVVLTKQLNSPNRILLLHLSVICLLLSIIYLWTLINNSIITSPSLWVNTATIPESAAITTSTLVNHYPFTSRLDNGDYSTHAPSRESLLSSSYCSFNDLLIHILQPIGLWTISCINFDRYYAICSPLHYNSLLTTKKVTIFLCSGWIIIILTISPIYLMLMISDDRHVMAVCWFKRINLRMEWERNFDKEYYWWEIQVLLTTLLTIFLPIILIVACNVKVLQIANFQQNRIATAIFESVLSAQVAITHQKNPFPPMPMTNFPNQPFFFPPRPNPFEMKRKSQKAARIVFELIASIVIFYCPYYLFVIIFSFFRKRQQLKSQPNEQQSEDVLNIVICLVQFLIVCTPTMNAILYGFKNKTIQENIRHYWRKQKTKIELHYEIQARTPSTCGSRRASLTEITSNMPQSYQPNQNVLKRQLSDFFFGTSSSLTSHLNNDDLSMFNSNKIHRTPSDSMFNVHNGRKSSRDFHHEYLSPNFEPLGKIIMPPPPPPSIKMSTSPSTSKNMNIMMNNFKKLLVGSKNDVRDDERTTHDGVSSHFPKILITKHSDSLLNTQSTSRRESDIQQVSGGEECAEKEPLLTQTCSLENVNSAPKKDIKKFQTL